MMRRACFTAIFALAIFFAANIFAADAPVTVSENENSFTLANGMVTARIAKRTGDLISLRYQNRELLQGGSGHSFGYWSHDASHGEHQTRITIDPQTNGGERAEVSVKGIFSPDELVANSRAIACDIEIRYTLERGLPGIYTYSIFEHQTNYPAAGIGEARFAAKLNLQIFDYLNIDAARRKIMPTPQDWLDGTELNLPEARRLNTGIYRGQVEHKYDYAANQFTTRAYGWIGTPVQIGIWFINPSVEYLSGGPTKSELTGHLDISDEAAAVLLNYWRSSHYGGANCWIPAGENWNKVVGPFLIYCNSAPTPDAMWSDALAREKMETAAWPYDWISGVDYPHKNERSIVRGQIFLRDSQMPSNTFTNLLVGLTASDYELPPPPANRRFNFNLAPRMVDWQNDAKHYEFWTRAAADGHFEIPNVRAGDYTLHAIADGVLGELVLTNVTVAAGKILNLGELRWQPVRYGRQLWDIGIPNHSGAEFFKGDDYFHWGWYLEYPKLFPNDVHFVISQSDFRKDWFFEQVPHNENPANTNGKGRGRSTTWAIQFNLTNLPLGKATLRLAICGSSTSTITVGVNDKTAGVITAPFYNATINRDGIAGYWSERDLSFDASLLRAGQNVLTLTIPAGSLTSGIIYDYLRLELDESAPPPKISAENKNSN
jgi:rhamnogalacturonan endolyase